MLIFARFKASIFFLLMPEPTYSTQPEEKLVWTNALAYYAAEVNKKECINFLKVSRTRTHLKLHLLWVLTVCERLKQHPDNIPYLLVGELIDKRSTNILRRRTQKTRQIGQKRTDCRDVRYSTFSKNTIEIRLECGCLQKYFHIWK